MVITEAEIAAFIQQYSLPMVRIGTMFMVMPVIGSRIVLPRVRLVLAFLVSLIVVPLLPEMSVTPSLSFETIVSIVKEFSIGLVIGYTLHIVFQIFVLGGQIIAMKMGLGFAAMNDPTNGIQSTVISQFFLIAVTLIFVTGNGHLVLISLIVESFQFLPVGVSGIPSNVYLEIVNLGSWMFASALVFALPVITSLLFVNIAFGVMSRAAPQLNIFAVGFPFTLISGLLLIWLGLTNLLPSFENATEHGFIFLHDVLGAP